MQVVFDKEDNVPDTEVMLPSVPRVGDTAVQKNSSGMPTQYVVDGIFWGLDTGTVVITVKGKR